MKSTDLTKQGFPKNHLRGSDFAYSPGCGGSGIGSCAIPASFRYIWWRLYPTNFITFNRKLTLQNIDFKSYLNAGSDGLCPNSNGASQEYDVILSYRGDGGIFSDADISSRVTISSAQSLPFYIDFSYEKIPQPTDSRWQGLIYVIIDLKATGRMIGNKSQTDMVLQATNFDYDERI